VTVILAELYDDMMVKMETPSYHLATLAEFGPFSLFATRPR